MILIWSELVLILRLHKCSLVSQQPSFETPSFARVLIASFNLKKNLGLLDTYQFPTTENFRCIVTMKFSLWKLDIIFWAPEKSTDNIQDKMLFQWLVYKSSSRIWSWLAEVFQRDVWKIFELCTVLYKRFSY